MKLERAKEIFDSYGVVNVNYKSKSVWIEDIHLDEKTVHVKILPTDEVLEVPVEELLEE